MRPASRGAITWKIEMALQIKKQNEQRPESWREYEGVKFNIRGLDYKPYRVALERAGSAQFRDGISLKGIDENAVVWYDLQAEAAGRYLIAGWDQDGITDEDGKSIAYSQDNAVALLRSSDIGYDLYKWVLQQAAEIQADADQNRDNAVKKS